MFGLTTKSPPDVDTDAAVGDGAFGPDAPRVADAGPLTLCEGAPVGRVQSIVGDGAHSFSLDTAGDGAFINLMSSTQVVAFPVGGIASPNAVGTSTSSVKISPDGHAIFVVSSGAPRQYRTTTPGTDYAIAATTATGSASVTGLPTNTVSISQPTTGSSPRIIVTQLVTAGTTHKFTEYEQGPDGSWTVLPTNVALTAATLGLPSGVDLSEPDLSPDGTQLAFLGVSSTEATVYVATRMSTSFPFGTATAITSDPDMVPDAPYLTPNCADLYISASGGVIELTAQ